MDNVVGFDCGSGGEGWVEGSKGRKTGTTVIASTIKYFKKLKQLINSLGDL